LHIPNALAEPSRKALGDIETNTRDFAFAKRYKLLKLVVNPEQLLLAILRHTVLTGELYVDLAAVRSWAKCLESGRKLQVRYGPSIYDEVNVLSPT
jgi:hypothetical protein